MSARLLSLLPLLLATFLLLPAQAYARAGGDDLLPVVPPMPGQVVQFQHLTNEDGLLSDDVNRIYQDSQGYIWISTWDGLQRYDGYGFRNFLHDPDDPSTISYDAYVLFLEDSSGNFWFATSYGLNLFDRTTETFTRLFPEGHDPDRDSFNIFDVAESSLGGLWLATGDGLYYFDPETGQFLTYRHDPDDPESLSGDFISSVLEDARGELWVSSFSEGLQRLASPLSEVKKSNEAGVQHPLRFERIAIDDDSETNRGVLLWEDSTGVLWFGTRNGLARLDADSDENPPSFTIFRRNERDPYSLSGNHILSFHEDSEGFLWFGTVESGLNQYDRESGKFRRYENDGQQAGMRSEAIVALYEDVQGQLWIGTGNNGVSILDRRPLAFGYYRPEVGNPDSLSHSKVNSVWEGADDDLWIGTQDGLNHLVDNDPPRFEHYFHDPDDPSSLSSGHISEVVKDSSGTVWVGTYDGGLNRLPSGSSQFQRLTHDENDPASLISDRVYGMTVDNADNIWVATSEGLDRISGGDTPAIDHVYVNRERLVALLVDSQGNLWFGGDDGLKRIAQQDLALDSPPITHFFYSDDEEYGSNSVQNIAEDEEGFLWIGTFDTLQKFDPSTEEFVAWYNGEPPEFAHMGSHGLLFDDEGYLWGGSGNIYRLDPKTATITEFTDADGVMSGSVVKASDGPSGRIFFYGSDGLNAFYPQNIVPHDFIPPTVLTDFRLYNESVSVEPEGVLKQHVNAVEQIVLDHDDDIFAFDFSALNYHNPRRNEYAYYLEGFDDDWITTDANNRRATYTNIPPGDYTFHVKGSNDAGVWDEEGASVSIKILPPWWQTWWARASMLLLVVGFGYTVYRWRVHALEQETRRLEIQIADRTEELATFFDLAVIERDGTSLTAIVAATLPRILIASRSEAIAVHLFSEDRTSMQLIGQQGLAPEAEHAMQLVPIPAGLGHWTSKTAAPLSTQTLPSYQDIPAALRRPEHQSYLGVQIRTERLPRGIFNCYRHSDEGYTLEEISFLTALADQLGIMIENYRLRQAVQETAVTAERQRMARELHDSVTQSMYSLVLLAEGGQRLARTGHLDDPDAYLGELEDIALQSLREMRLLVYELRPNLLTEEGFVGALEHRLDAVERRAGVETSFLVDGQFDLSPIQGQAFFGIAQEALNNALKHAMASRLDIKVETHNSSVILEVADDGIGFDPNFLADTGGMGMETMQERADQMGATLSLISAPGEGTTVRVTLEES